MIESFIIVSGLFALLSVLKDVKNKHVLFWPFTLLLVLFYGLRWEMGTDWVNYYKYFLVADVYNQPGFEPGFILYTHLIRSVTENYSIYLLITTAITFIGVFYPVFKMTKGSFLSLFYLTGTLTWYAGSLRQMIACVLFTLAVQATFARRPVKYLLLMVTALTFHATILAFMPIYWLFGVSTSALMLIFVALALISIFARDIIIIISAFTPYLYGKDISQKLGGTLELSNPLFGFLRKALTTAAFVGLSLTARGSPRIDALQWEKIKYVLMLSSISIILYYVGTYSVTDVSSRVDIYLTIICTGLLIGFLDRAFTRRVNRLALFGFVTLLVAVFYSRLQFNDLFHPYSSIFYNYDLHRDLY